MITLKHDFLPSVAVALTMALLAAMWFISLAAVNGGALIDEGNLIPLSGSSAA